MAVCASQKICRVIQFVQNRVTVKPSLYSTLITKAEVHSKGVEIVSGSEYPFR
jgi:hypothetical protein